MIKLPALLFFGSIALLAQTPDLTGVWKADLQKSKIPGPPGSAPTRYLIMIERRQEMFNRATKEMAPAIVETTGIWSERGEQRSVLSVFENGRPSIRPYQGVPTRLTATSGDNLLTVKGEVSGRPDTFTRIYKLGADRQTLTVDISSSREGRTTTSSLELVRQPDAEAKPLRSPEELAQTHFKNVKTDALKTLPASEFINQMRYFAWALNRNCEFCHVEHKFDSDEKEEKRTARKMIDMAASINQTYFEGHPEVRCFTCHEGHGHPLSHPQFPEEAAAEKAALETEAAQHRPSLPGQAPPTK